MTRSDEFDLTDKKSLVESKKRTRKYGPNVAPPYPNGWYALEQSRNLKPGTATNVDCLGENFVVFRSNTNEVFVLDAYCKHMGANIGVGGMVKGNCVMCPFHSWTFSGETGECVDIPYSKNCEDVKKQAKLKKWISKEANGFIFVWYHVENEEPWELPEYDLSDLNLFYVWDFVVHSHIQEFLENGADENHFSTVHNASTLAGKKAHGSWLGDIAHQITNSKWEPDPDKFYISHINTTFKIDLFGKLQIYSLRSGATIFGPGLTVFKVKPAFSFVTMFIGVTPIDAYSYRMTALVYSPIWFGWFAKYAAYTFLVNLYRDKQIWDSKQFMKNYLLVKEEKSIRKAQLWYSKFYSPNSKTFEEAKRSMEW